MKRKFLWFFIISGGLILLDQITKIIAADTLKGKSPAELIPGVLELRYIENRGAAWGMMQGAGIFFIILTCAVMAGRKSASDRCLHLQYNCLREVSVIS